MFRVGIGRTGQPLALVARRAELPAISGRASRERNEDSFFWAMAAAIRAWSQGVLHYIYRLANFTAPVTTPVQTRFRPAGTPSAAFWLCFALSWASQLFATDWPQWRGPDRNANWSESGIVERLPTNGLKIRWRAPIAMGYSSPVIVGVRFISATRN